MRAKSLIVAFFFLVVCLATAPFAVAASKSVSFLHLRLEGPRNPVTLTDLGFRVALESTGAGCHPVYIDPLFSPFELPHRGSRLAIYLYDEQGNKLTPQSGYPPNVVRLTPDRLLLLDCGAFYGSIVRLSGPSMWSTPLSPGHYRARAELQLLTRRVAEEETGFIEILSKRHGSLTSAKQSLVDAVLLSDEISFAIVSPQK